MHKVYISICSSVLGNIKDKIKDGKRYLEIHGDDEGIQSVLFPEQTHLHYVS